ncbi:guaA [Symbiodinium sp. CCMP2592]|nr:guaA [Symbiodinium sp. CCMP2592]
MGLDEEGRGQKTEVYVEMMHGDEAAGQSQLQLSAFVLVVTGIGFLPRTSVMCVGRKEAQIQNNRSTRVVVKRHSQLACNKQKEVYGSMGGWKRRALLWLDGLASKFPQWASNFIFVDELPPDFSVTAVDSANRVMAMEHVEDHVYGLQWHPEVINSKVGRKIVDRIFSLVGKRRTAPRGISDPPQGVKVEPPTGSLQGPEDVEVFSWHEVDLELRRLVKELIQSSGGGRASADLGKLLAGRRRELMTTLRSSHAAPRVGADGDGSLGEALGAASASLREVASAWLLNPAPAG